MIRESAKLYVVSTPIGNLKDITFRAVETLKQCSLIIAEDTRNTKKLLHHYGISTPVESYHKFNERKKTREVIERIKQGMDAALVSDAGTPGVSDPGAVIIKECIEGGIGVEAIPGAFAGVSAFVLSGFESEGFVFRGFLPKKEGRLKKEIEKMADMPYPVIIYESPKRIKKTLEAAADVMDDPRVSVSKELTKRYETTLRGSARQVMEMLSDDMLKGEFTAVIMPGKEKKRDNTREAEEYLGGLLKKGVKKSTAIKETAEKFGVNRNMLYRESHKD